MHMRACSSRDFMTSQTSKRRKDGLTFLEFPSMKFCEVCILHDIDGYLTLSCFDKIVPKDFFFLNQKRGICKILRML